VAVVGDDVADAIHEGSLVVLRGLDRPAGAPVERLDGRIAAPTAAAC